jgi:hypothetical protein
MNKKTLKAQALAIVMVVLVVASIIGVSLFSRVSKDKDASINEQDSSISSSLVDAVLDFFVGAEISEIESSLTNHGGPQQVLSVSGENLNEVIKELDDIDIIPNITSVSDDDGGDWCTGESNIDLTISYEDDDDFIEIQPGSVRVYNLEGSSFSTTPCNLKVNMKPVEDVSIFVVKKVMNDGTDITESVSNYCIGSEEACLEVNDVEYEENIERVEDMAEGVYYMNFVLNTAYNDDNVVEIRILPIKGVLAINTEIGDCIQNKQLKSIKFTAEANCNDTYRGKQMFTPGSGNLGYSTLFDYGIYDMGLFQP